MKLSYNKHSKDPIYYVQQGFRNGKKTSTRNIKRIGKHSEMLAFTDDPLAYAVEYVRKMNEEYKKGKVSQNITLDFDEKVLPTSDTATQSTARNVGYFFLQAVYNDLKIPDFFKKISEGRRFTFSPNDINRFLIYGRVLDPASKFYTWHHLDQFYEQPDFDYQHIMRTLDLLAENYDGYLSHLFRQSNNVVKRDASVCYFDCTNFYFEVECPDEDYVDPVTGEVRKGFRQYGYSKQHQPLPIVQMGLYMDAQGIPISMCLDAGNTNEQLMEPDAEDKLLKMLDNRKIIYCADAGLGSMNIRRLNDTNGKAFIVTQSVKKLSGPLKEAIFNDCDYRLLSDNSPVNLKTMKTFDKSSKENRRLYEDKAYKVLSADKAVDLGLYETKQDKRGRRRKMKSTAALKQRIIITFSRKAMEYQRYIRARQIERAEKMLKGLDPETYKKGPNDVTRFIRRKGKNSKEDEYFIDYDRIREEEKYDGFYAVATNLFDDDIKEILAIMDRRYKIEECFRIMKTSFDARPVFCHTREHITAHFMICYTALLIYRLLEIRVNQYGASLTSGAEHYTADNIIETLQNMNVVNMQDMYYAAVYNGSKTLNALNAVYNLKLDRRYYEPKSLNKKLKKILKT
jgi:transposase